MTQTERRRGFLPFETNAFDRVFISVVTGIAAFLLYFRFLEPNIPLWVPVPCGWSGSPCSSARVERLFHTERRSRTLDVMNSDSAFRHMVTTVRAR